MNWFIIIANHFNCMLSFFSINRNQTLKDCYEEITFQGDFVRDLVKEGDYGYDVDVDDIFNSWEDDKHNDILTYR